MHCTEARLHLLDYERGRLPLDTERAVQDHLDACSACTRAATAERALTELLERELPQHPASLALKRRLAAPWLATIPARRVSWSRWAWSFGPALAAVVLLIVWVPLLSGERTVRRERDAAAAMITEAVNDHLRLLDRPRPLDVESGGMHQVKPWFTGRLDFAPVVAFVGDEAFPLKGGAIGYFVDRRAAVFVYGRRLHSITLFVFRAAELPWPTHGLRPLGSIAVYATAARGFNVILWKRADLGYALVSDLDSTELLQLARLISGGSCVLAQLSGQGADSNAWGRHSLLGMHPTAGRFQRDSNPCWVGHSTPSSSQRPSSTSGSATGASAIERARCAIRRSERSLPATSLNMVWPSGTGPRLTKGPV